MRLSALHRKILYLVALPVVVALVAMNVSTFLFDHVKVLNGLSVEDKQHAEAMRSHAEPNPDIVVVTFDSETPGRLGLGPDVTRVPRKFHAEMLKRLDQAGAKVALLDVIFGVPKPGDEGFRTVLHSLKTLNVTLATSNVEGKDMTPGPIPHGPMYPISVWDDPKSDRVRVGSVFELKAEANSLLLGGNPIQRDTNSQRQIVYAPLSAALQSHGVPSSKLVLDELHQRLTADALQWNLNQNLAIDARWTEKATPFNHWDYVDAYNALGSNDPAKSAPFRDKIVIIGYYGPEDMHETAPFGRIHGVDFIAQMTNTALLAYNSQFQVASDGIYLPYCFTLCFAAFLAFRTKRVLLGAIGVAGLAATCFGLQRWMAVSQDLYLPAARPLSMMILTSVTGVLFARYWTDDVDLSPPSASEEATVLFLDIKGSTKLLNSIGRDRYQELLDGLFGKYTLTVNQNGGKIERTLGDGFIAIFRKAGSRHHALRCSQCAKELVEITREVALRQEVKVEVALGFESGIIGGGYVSEGGKKVWSSSGQAIHLAQRLQSLCGPLDLTVAVGPLAKRLIAEEETCPVITHAAVKGFEEEIEVSRLL